MSVTPDRFPVGRPRVEGTFDRAWDTSLTNYPVEVVVRFAPKVAAWASRRSAGIPSQQVTTKSYAGLMWR